MVSLWTLGWKQEHVCSRIQLTTRRLIGDLEEEHAAAAAVRAEMVHVPRGGQGPQACCQEELRESVRVMSRTVRTKRRRKEMTCKAGGGEGERSRGAVVGKERGPRGSLHSPLPV